MQMERGSSAEEDMEQQKSMSTDSDQEVTDQVGQTNVCCKEMKYRVIKKILHVGTGGKKPSNDDEIKVRYHLDVAKDAEIGDLESKEVKFIDLGATERDPETNEWLDYTVKNMRRGEIAHITVRYYKEPADGWNVMLPPEKRVISHLKYHIVQLVDFVSVNDLDYDKGYLKKILEKGDVTRSRVGIYDDVQFTLKVTRGEKVILQHETKDFVRVPKDETKKEEAPKKAEGFTDDELVHSHTILKLLKGMSKDETAHLRVTPQKFRDVENLLCALIPPAEAPKAEGGPAPAEEPLIFVMKITDLVKIEDIFENGTILKRKLTENMNEFLTAGNLSRVAISLKIYVDGKEVYSNGEVPTGITEEQRKDIDALKAHHPQVLDFYLDDYKVSKMLKLTLKSMKRTEHAEILIGSRLHIKTGVDSDVIRNVPTTQKVKYDVILHGFTDDKTSYSMTTDDKIFHANRKREIGVRMIKENRYKKAWKVFTNVNSFFDIGTHSEEDKTKFRAVQLSALLNTSLCQLKLQKWTELLPTVDKILKMDPGNPKALYRKASALYQQEYFEAAKEIATKTMNELPEGDQKNEFKILLDHIAKSTQVYEAKQKKMFAKIFD